MRRFATAGVIPRTAAGIAALMLLAGFAPDKAQVLQPALYTDRVSTRARLLLVGHDGASVSSLPVQHITSVAALRPRNKDGSLDSFSTAYTAFVPDELKSWRLTILNGKLMGRTFQIAGNGPDSITVTDLNGPLDSIAVSDSVMIESIVVRDIPLR